MKNFLDTILNVLSGRIDPELNEQLDDPSSEVSTLLRALRIRARSAFSIKPKALKADPTRLPILKFADLFSPPGFKLFPRTDRTRITKVEVRPLKTHRGKRVATASVTLNDDVVIGGIAVLRGPKDRGFVVRIPRRHKVVVCPCGTKSGLGANYCAKCGRRLPKPGKNPEACVATTTRTWKRGEVAVEDSRLLSQIRRRVLVGYHEALLAAGAAPFGFSENPQSGGEAPPNETLQLSLELPPATPGTDSEKGAPQEGAPGETGADLEAGPEREPESESSAEPTGVGAASAPAAPRGSPPDDSMKSPAGGDHSGSADDDFALSHPLLQRYWRPSERLAIVLHWFCLCAEDGREVPMSEAVASWESGPGQEWRRERFWLDLAAQTDEIQRHRWFMGEKAGRDVGWDVAQDDWLKKYGEAWRNWREQETEPF